MPLMALCYLIGSFPTAYLVGRKVAGIDIRQVGDGNAGAANVYRQVGAVPGVVVGVVDVAKGSCAVLVPGFLSSNEGLALAGGAASVMGHNFPFFLQFRGGRGAATTMGVLLVLVPKVFLPLALVAVVPLFRHRSMNLFFAMLYSPLPFALWFLHYPISLVGYSVVLPSLVGVTHYFTSRRVAEAL
ncbi:MAG: glycerol-3-phosphate acyltransferase [Chloroflexi bacterium]|nr:glycerol-3-phosphate acyltransferase [Chloroflexota bacterium]